MEITVRNLTKRFGASCALSGVTLTFPEGEFSVILGPSGCGKSTLLAIIAGLERPSEGAVRFGDEDVTALPPKERDVAMVFQDYALYPHMTVFGNVAFPLRMAKVPPDEIDPRVRDAVAMVEVTHLLDRRPAQLSGGERQRVALARALVRRPVVFLMDEPLSNLDARLRAVTRTELRELQRRLKITTLYVTHDQLEAMTLGDWVTVLRDGTVQQHGRPRDIYERPANLFVAEFVGSPPMNVAPARVEPAEGVLVATVGEHRLRLPEGAVGDVRGQVYLGCRPEALRVTAEAPTPGADPVLKVRLDAVEFTGGETMTYFEVAGGRWASRAPSSPRLDVGDEAWVSIPLEALLFFDGGGALLR